MSLPEVTQQGVSVDVNGTTLTAEASIVAAVADQRIVGTEELKAAAMQKHADEVAKLRELAEKSLADQEGQQFGAIPTVQAMFFNAYLSCIDKCLKEDGDFKDELAYGVAEKAAADYARFLG